MIKLIYPSSLISLTDFAFVEFPKKQSSILADMKEEDQKGQKRANDFLTKCEQINEMRKQRRTSPQGSIADKDLSKC